MPRPRRIVVENGYYHLYNRFVSGESFFYNEKIVNIFFEIFIETANKWNIDIFILYCMPTHFHSLIKINEENLSEFIHQYSTNFARKVNFLLNRHGHIFGGRHKSSLLDKDQYLINLTHYIFNNAVRAGLVEKAEDYQYSNLSNILKYYNANRNYHYLLTAILNKEELTKNDINDFLNWLNSDIKEDPDIVKKIKGQFLMDAKIKNKFLQKVDRRKENLISSDKKRRKYEIRDFLHLKKIIEKKVKILLNPNKEEINKLWKSSGVAFSHILWYILRNRYNLKLKEIALLYKIYRHQTISNAITYINKDIEKRKLLEKILQELEN